MQSPQASQFQGKSSSTFRVKLCSFTDLTFSTFKSCAGQRSTSGTHQNDLTAETDNYPIRPYYYIKHFKSALAKHGQAIILVVIIPAKHGVHDGVSSFVIVPDI